MSDEEKRTLVEQHETMWAALEAIMHEWAVELGEKLRVLMAEKPSEDADT